MGKGFEIIDNIEYRYVTLRNRTKLIARDGSAINPVRRNQKCTIHINADGYPCFGGGIPVHLYVAHGWVDGWFEGAEVNHKDFNRMNYHADNLEWVTHTDNLNYTLKNNYDTVCKSKQGERNGRSIYTVDQVRQIRNMYDSGMSVADITRTFYPDKKTRKEYVSFYSTISLIAKRKSWKTV